MGVPVALPAWFAREEGSKAFLFFINIYITMPLRGADQA
jgi:hypothetical protein